MRYIHDFSLNYQNFESVYQMYPDIQERDIVCAKYRRVPGEEMNPDICALPPLLSQRDLIADNATPFLGYSRDAIASMAKSERIASLAKYKDQMRVYLPYQSYLERQFRECLLSAYRKRSYGYKTPSGENQMVVCSLARRIASSVQDMSLIGTPGTGKSTSVEIMLRRYPQAIKHTFKDFSYIQIPYLCTTAHSGTDIKSIYIDLARSIDQILESNYYEKKMSKEGTIPKMESYLISLIELLHVGIIIIDEIQLAVNNTRKMFEHILSVTASSGVSVMVIGTEDAVKDLNKSEWFARRFSHLGLVQSDIPRGSLNMGPIIMLLWFYQWTKKHYDLTQGIVDLLKEESCNNIDFLTTILIEAQLLVITSEGTANEIALDRKTIKKAASMFPNAKGLIQKGISTLEENYKIEKQRMFSAISKEADLQKRKETSDLVQESVDIITKKSTALNDVIRKLEILGYTDKRHIENLFNRLWIDKQFQELSSSEMAKFMLAEFLKDDGYIKNNRKKEKKVQQDLEIQMEDESGSSILEKAFS